MINVGDRVKCIDVSGKWSYGCPLVLNREYIVYSTHDGCCGGTIDIGVHAELDGNRCMKCGKIEVLPKGIWWFATWRFAKVEEKYRVVEVATFIKEDIKETIQN